MKRVLFAIALVCLTTRAPSASTFLSQGESKTKMDRKELVERLSPDGKTIVIDDMVFRLDRIEKSGFSIDLWPDGDVYYEFVLLATKTVVGSRSRVGGRRGSKFQRTN